MKNEVNLNIEEAFEFYKSHILCPQKTRKFKEYGFPTSGSVNSLDWELFSAILLNERKNECSHTDLLGFEVKSSASDGVSHKFEYHYQRDSALSKFEAERNVSHIYISYSQDYKNIELSIMNPSNFQEILEGWQEEFNYFLSASTRRVFRKSVRRSFVSENSQLILKISNGEIEYYSPPITNS